MPEAALRNDVFEYEPSETVCEVVDGRVRIDHAAMGRGFDRMFKEAGLRAPPNWCHEHRGRTKMTMYRCGSCGQNVCEQCARVAMKHQPCPKTAAFVRDTALANAINPVLALNG